MLIMCGTFAHQYSLYNQFASSCAWHYLRANTSLVPTCDIILCNLLSAPSERAPIQLIVCETIDPQQVRPTHIIQSIYTGDLHDPTVPKTSPEDHAWI